MDNTQQPSPPSQPAENTSPTPSVQVPSSPSQTTPPQSQQPPAPPETTQPPRKRNFLPIIAFLVLFLGFGLLAFWYYQTATKKDMAENPSRTPAKVAEPRTIIVGTDPTYPPMEYKEGDNLMGYDIDLANFLGSELGAQIKFKEIIFDDLFPALESREIDMIISTVTVSDERKKNYDFSEAYLQAGQVILTQKSNNTIVTTENLLGKKIGVQKGTTIETEALKYTSDTLVIRYPDFVQATAALVKGEVDAIFADLPGAKGIVNENPTLKISSDPFTAEYYAIVFRKGDPSIPEVNEALSSLRVKGILTELSQKWLDQ